MGGVHGQRARGGERKNGVADIVSDDSSDVRTHAKGCGVDGGRIHRLAEGGGDERKGTHPGRTIGRSNRNDGRVQTCGLRVAVWIAASGDEKEHEECYEPDLMRAFFT